MADIQVGPYPGMMAPDISALAFIRTEFKQFELKSMKGKTVLLYFYPLDFGYISPTELVLIQRLKKEDDNVVAISTGSPFAKSAWNSAKLYEGGLEFVDFPLVSDVKQDISESYKVLKEGSGYTFRTFFIVNGDGMIMARYENDLPLGLGITESQRVYQKVSTLTVHQDPTLDSGFSSIRLFQLTGGDRIPDKTRENVEIDTSDMTRRNSDGRRDEGRGTPKEITEDKASLGDHGEPVGDTRIQKQNSDNQMNEKTGSPQYPEQSQREVENQPSEEFSSTPAENLDEVKVEITNSEIDQSLEETKRDSSEAENSG